MHSRTAAIIGAGRRYPANTSSDASSRPLIGGNCVFGGVDGGTTRLGNHFCVGISGLVNQNLYSYP